MTAPLLVPATSTPDVDAPGCRSSATQGREPEPAGALCAACPHPAAGHDTIGARFCAATIGSAMTRGCVCRAG